MCEINSILVTDGDGKVLDSYVYVVDSLGEKLSQKKAKRIEKEENKRREEQDKKRLNESIFKASKKKFKEFSPMVKKLLKPLVKALKKNYRVDYIFTKSKNYSSINACWKIYAGDYCLGICFGGLQKDFDLYLRNTSLGRLESKKEYFGSADLTEESLKSEIKGVFIDYINSQE